MSGAPGQTLPFMAKSAALVLGVGYGTFRTSWLARKENKIQQKQTVAAKKKAAIQARKSAKKAGTEEPGLFDELFKEDAK
mmetsp:Transcript_15675/g.32240  ORF Transcript_15675/g.32240 Transcript_15675/m.32240 type:complete len:80 (+) Transcript_15675:119-358(+)|eukprot:CAMPEP_0196736872 /NCGR_PEP_ID=MMETSP1091-20130531/14796_1 /TAXON_ID=302021 /ORGANISM="Rhodomonas sp., Strain CCMP768" /LENGTH=79 /DNA_ID=CAMNT_0042080659 /DNA_START=95 /DNA_END=334 /DNA_ORIENTATION=-